MDLEESVEDKGFDLELFEYIVTSEDHKVVESNHEKCGLQRQEWKLTWRKRKLGRDESVISDLGHGKVEKRP